MNYLCLVDGLVKYVGTDLNYFNHYRMIHAEKHKDAENVEYLMLTDEAYNEMFPCEDEE